MKTPVTIIGAGLAGCEAAWQLARRGRPVHLYEMRPLRSTQAHTSDRCAELVCSNSLGSLLPDRAMGILKNELTRLGSLIIAKAYEHAVPAGGALAVSRDDFARSVTTAMEEEPLIDLRREELSEIPDGPVILASGPLTSPALTAKIQELAQQKHLFFYDAMAPIIDAESIDLSIAFRQSRRGINASPSSDSSEGEEEGDYINCPFNRDEYERFIDALLAAPRIPLEKADEGTERYFECCMPVEVLAARGRRSLAFGPMRPIGLKDPRSGFRLHAVVQLRQDDLAATLYNMVGFQTNLRWGPQEEVLRLIPGLQNARFVRLGQMHRNTFVNSPELLHPSLEWKGREGLFLAGQIAGTEGYVGSTMGGLVAAINLSRRLEGKDPLALPPQTMMGALLHYITHCPPKRFQPMKANIGILPPLETKIRSKRERGAAHATRAKEKLEAFLEETEWGAIPGPKPQLSCRSGDGRPSGSDS